MEGKILEKPSDANHAVEMLTDLSGKRHSVITAVVLCIASPGSETPRLVEFYEETFVKFSSLSRAMIDSYVATGSPMYETHLERKVFLFGRFLALDGIANGSIVVKHCIGTRQVVMEFKRLSLEVSLKR